MKANLVLVTLTSLVLMSHARALTAEECASARRCFSGACAGESEAAFRLTFMEKRTPEGQRAVSAMLACIRPCTGNYRLTEPMLNSQCRN